MGMKEIIKKASEWMNDGTLKANLWWEFFLLSPWCIDVFDIYDEFFEW